LALELGYVNVDRMLEEVDFLMFEEWKAFFNWRHREAEKLANGNK
jgi:hypothetical protein